ncbi:MAG: TolC family protein [Verrucomicrobiota bacterium]
MLFSRFFLSTLLLFPVGPALLPAAEPAASPRRLTLNEAYDRALATDQSISLALQAVVQADLLPARAWTRLTPRLNGTLNSSQSGSRARGQEFSSNQDGRARLSLSQPLLDFTVKPAVRAGQLAAQESRMDYRGTVRDIILGVATAYYDVLRQQELIAVNRESLRLAEEQKNFATQRMEVGEVIRTDVLTADVTVQRARRSLTESENALRLARTILANALNLDPETVFEVIEPPGYALPGDSLHDLQIKARNQRDDLQRLLTAIARRTENLAETRAGYLPSVSASVSAGRGVQQNSNSSGTDGQTDYSAGLSVSIPLFTGGEKALDLKQAESEIIKAKLEYERSAKASDEEVTSAWLQTQTLRQTLASLRAEVKSAEENHSLVQQQYLAGATKSLDVLQALTDLNTSRTDLTVSLFQYQLALRELAARTADFERARIEQSAARLTRPAPSSPLVVPAAAEIPASPPPISQVPAPASKPAPAKKPLRKTVKP